MAYFRYREKMHLTYAQMLLEPIEAIHFAIAVWEADAKRDKLDSRKQEAATEEQRTKQNGQTVEPS